ncbi:hypothetical protein SAMN05421736_105237 [Evansella caseinilytica]|uniref:Uncharacterized protein n=1 Tax=Evansella caseinilytica TaxID=1503961 RepID=A0A1H3PVE5_9BACI|nr:hypothetical protein SAMN05421736_105237 [Evansella caseinilytica]
MRQSQQWSARKQTKCVMQRSDKHNCDIQRQCSPVFLNNLLKYVLLHLVLTFNIITYDDAISIFSHLVMYKRTTFCCHFSSIFKNMCLNSLDMFHCSEGILFFNMIFSTYVIRLGCIVQQRQPQNM